MGLATILWVITRSSAEGQRGVEGQRGGSVDGIGKSANGVTVRWVRMEGG